MRWIDVLAKKAAPRDDTTVADRMAEAVVDELEAVDVDEQHRATDARVASAAGDLLLDGDARTAVP